MQKLNPREDYDIAKLKHMIEELAFKKIITEKERESINPYKVLAFTKSNIWQDLKNSKEYYQEKPFYINVPASDIYDEDVSENILVQGIIDCILLIKMINLFC